MSPESLLIGERLMFWISIGAMLAFLPYFPISKHIHLFFAPINFALKPERRSMGEMSYINLDDQSIEQFGAATMKDLGWEQIMDSLRLHHVLPLPGDVPGVRHRQDPLPRGPGDQQALSPQRRRRHGRADAGPDPGGGRLGLHRLRPCVDICPVGNEPMRDILDIRRNLTLMESSFPKQLETAFKGMERNANPWNVSQADRMKWAAGLERPDHRTESRARYFVVGGLRAGDRFPRPEDRPGLCQDFECGRR